MAYGYTAHSYNGNPPYSLKERIRSLIDDIGEFNIDYDEYHTAKVYCPSYSTNKQLNSSVIESLDKYKEKSKEHFSNYNNDQLKKEMLVSTVFTLFREKDLLEALALYMYSTDNNVVDYELKKGAPKDIISTSESHRLGRLISKLDYFKYDYYLLQSISRKNKTLMFLED